MGEKPADRVLIEVMRLKFVDHESALAEIVRLRRVIARNKTSFERLKAAKTPPVEEPSLFDRIFRKR